jgi:NADH-quinone oxidoreductase subunit C
MSEQQAPGKPAESQLEPGQFGQFLAEHGIPSRRLPDSSGVETIVLEGENLEQSVKRLRNSPETKLDFLVAVSGIDSADTFDSVYHLWSYSNQSELVIKVCAPKSDVPEGHLPMVPSIAPFWKAADWHERETYDLVGIRYVGHPYLRRILNPWDWDGHPLRRDYRQPVDALNDKSPGSFR